MSAKRQHSNSGSIGGTASTGSLATAPSLSSSLSSSSLSPSLTAPPGSNSSFHKAFVYGSSSQRLETPTEQGHTHQWKLYIRSATDEPLTNYVKKVTFNLHSSFVNPNRVMQKEPFEVDEYGWGEFEAQIKVHFQSPTLKVVVLRHLIKLFPSEKTKEVNGELICETFDEFIFQHATPAMATFLSKAPQPTLLPEYGTQESEHIGLLELATKRVKHRTREIEHRHKEVLKKIEEVKAELTALQNNQGF